MRRLKVVSLLVIVFAVGLLGLGAILLRPAEPGPVGGGVSALPQPVPGAARGLAPDGPATQAETSAQLPDRMVIYNVTLQLEVGRLRPAISRIEQIAQAAGGFVVGSNVAENQATVSKKLAAGAQVIVLDVKVGSGAFMRRRPQAERLARFLVEIGRAAGRKVEAVLTDMNQPLGRAVGNALEVKEAILTLRGEGPEDLVAVCVELAGRMLWLAGRYPDLEAARRAARSVLAEGSALGKLADLVAAQGGDPALVWEPERLPAAPVRRTITARQPGYITRLDARRVGEAAVKLGAGRAKKGDPIDHRVGFVFYRKRVDWVTPGEPLFEVHARTELEADLAATAVLEAISLGDRRPPVRPVVLGTATT